MHPVALAVAGLLPVKWQVIGILGAEHLRGQPCGGQAAFLQARWPGRDERGSVRISTAHELAPDESAANEARRSVVEWLADLLPQATPGGRTRLDRFWVEDLLDNRQPLGQAGRACVLGWRTWRDWCGLQRRLSRCLRLGRGLVLHALQEPLPPGRVEWLTLAAEASANERVDLLAQARVLTLQTLVVLAPSGFAWSLAPPRSNSPSSTSRLAFFTRTRPSTSVFNPSSGRVTSVIAPMRTTLMTPADRGATRTAYGFHA